MQTARALRCILDDLEILSANGKRQTAKGGRTDVFAERQLPPTAENDVIGQH